MKFISSTPSSSIIHHASSIILSTYHHIIINRLIIIPSLQSSSSSSAPVASRFGLFRLNTSTSRTPLYHGFAHGVDDCSKRQNAADGAGQTSGLCVLSYESTARKMTSSNGWQNRCTLSGEATQRDNPFVISSSGLTRTKQHGTLGVPRRRRGARSR